MSQQNVKKVNTGMIIGGCSILGIGFGILFNQIPAGTLIGVGVGMLLSYYFKNYSK